MSTIEEAERALRDSIEYDIVLERLGALMAAVSEALREAREEGQAQAWAQAYEAVLVALWESVERDEPEGASVCCATHGWFPLDKPCPCIADVTYGGAPEDRTREDTALLRAAQLLIALADDKPGPAYTAEQCRSEARVLLNMRAELARVREERDANIRAADIMADSCSQAIAERDAAALEGARWRVRAEAAEAELAAQDDE